MIWIILGIIVILFVVISGIISVIKYGNDWDDCVLIAVIVIGVTGITMMSCGLGQLEAEPKTYDVNLSSGITYNIVAAPGKKDVTVVEGEDDYKFYATSGPGHSSTLVSVPKTEVFVKIVDEDIPQTRTIYNVETSIAEKLFGNPFKQFTITIIECHEDDLVKMAE